MSSAIPEKYRDLFSKRAFANLGTLDARRPSPGDADLV